MSTAPKHPVQINEGLLEGIDDLAASQRLEGSQWLKFDQRRIILGEGALDLLGDECRHLGVNRVLLVRDNGIAPLEEPVRAVLQRAGLTLVGTYDQISPNPTVDSVNHFAAHLAAASCDGVIALGGGSTIDTCKTGLCAAALDASVADFFGMDLIPEAPPWPLIALPTTSGTGSEVSKVSVIADQGGKQAVYSDFLTPRIALVDPFFSRHMPAVLTAITGLDALGHALECTASTKSTAIGDAIARAALQAGCLHLERAITKGAEDPVARYQMARCALLAGLLLSPINTGAGHALGYGIEKLSYERGNPVPHGTAVAMMLPGVIRHNAVAVADKYYYAAGVAGLDLKGKSRLQATELLAQWIDQLRRRHTPFTSLEAAGLNAEDIPRMREIGLGVRRLLDFNPVEVLEADATAIYQGALK